MKKIFITGGCGFIASHLIERLIAEGYDIRIYDNLHRNAVQFTKVLDHPKVEFIKGDITIPQDLEAAMKGCDMVIHMAAIAGVSSYHKFPAKTVQVNLIGTFYVLEAMRKNNINRLIDMSTSEVFGTEVIEASENSYLRIGPPHDKRWSYAVSKIAGEQMIYRYSEEYNWDVTIVRPFNVYGPRQVGEGAISNFCKWAIDGEDLKIDGLGSSIRSWCYISDFIEAMMLFIEKPNTKAEAFNVGSPWTSVSNHYLAELIIKFANKDGKVWKKPKISYHPMPYTDIKVRWPDIGKIINTYGWKPKIGIEEGVYNTYKWFSDTFKK